MSCQFSQEKPSLLGWFIGKYRDIDLETVEELIEKYLLLMTRTNNNGVFPFQVSLAIDRPDIAELFLSYSKEQLRILYKQGLNPLLFSILLKANKSARFLLDNYTTNIESNDPNEKLIYIDSTDYNGCTPLYTVVLQGNNEMIQPLIDKGANIFHKTHCENRDFSILGLAVYKNNIVKQLIF